MAEDLFDLALRRMRRNRALRTGRELFLHERAFDDCVERIGLVRRRFRSALIIGCADPAWPARLRDLAETIDAVEEFEEIEWDSQRFDLVVSIGELDTLNDLPPALLALRSLMREDALLVGAISGGETLPMLRAAIRAADQEQGSASPHVHPRIEAAALAPLLTAAGLVSPVVDVDRVRVAYRSFDSLVNDLRGMAVTNILKARDRRPLGKRALAAARKAFAAAGDGQRTTETFEILHFAAWTPNSDG